MAGSARAPSAATCTKWCICPWWSARPRRLEGASTSGSRCPAPGFRGCVLPAPVQPEVLLGKAAYQGLEAGGEALGDLPHGVRRIHVLLDWNDVLNKHAVVHGFRGARHAHDQ